MEDREEYDQGFIDALVAYAHWEDGVQYVGTSGTTLKEAIKTRKESWNYCPPKEGVKDWPCHKKLTKVVLK